MDNESPEQVETEFSRELKGSLKAFIGEKVSPALLVAIKEVVVRLVMAHVQPIGNVNVVVKEVEGNQYEFAISGGDDYTEGLLMKAFGYKPEGYDD